MSNSNTPALNAEQTLQDKASAPVINNSTDLNGQASATASVAQRTPLLDPPMATTPEERDKAVEVLKKAGFLDTEGHPCKKTYDASAEVRMRAEVKISTIKKAGFKLALIDQNRQIHTSNLKLLKKDLESLHETTFREAGKIIPARQAIEEGLKVISIDDQEVTRENADEYYVIIDGQHRYICCLEDPCLSMWMELAEFNGPTMTHVGLLNNTRKGWDSRDIRHAVMSKYPGQVSTLEEIQKYCKQFDVTEKYAELAITRKKDQFRRSELNAYQQGHEPADTAKYRCDEAKKDVAWEMMYSILIALKGNEKQLRKLKKIEFMAAIIDILATLQKCRDEEGMKQFEQNISTFISHLTPEQIDEIVDLIDSKNFAELNNMVNQAYFSFIKDNEAGLDALRQKNKKAIKALKSELAASPTTRKAKVGSPSEVMKTRVVIAVETSRPEESSACKDDPAAIDDQQHVQETKDNEKIQVRI